MNAREDIAARLWINVPSKDNADAKARTEEMLDAYRAEVLAEAKVETVGWLVKKAAEERAANTCDSRVRADAIGKLASKVDRGAVRAFIGTGHYRDAMDAHRAEVLREAADALDESEALRDLTDDHMADVNAAANELRRMADEAGPDTPPTELTIYRASHDSIVMGHYTTREAARAHCETLTRRECGDAGALGWVPDDGSDDAPEELSVFGPEAGEPR